MFFGSKGQFQRMRLILALVQGIISVSSLYDLIRIRTPLYRSHRIDPGYSLRKITIEKSL